MKYYLIAGERSGDLHGAHLIEEIKRNDPHAEFRVWGGDMMQQAGGHLVQHYRNLSFMGFWEVLTNLWTIRGYLKQCKGDIKAFQPDVLILIDYPGFNLRMARYGHQQGLKVVYYISPKIWAWNRSRVHKIKRYVDELYSILPFEPTFYDQYQYQVKYVGNPLVTQIGDYLQKHEVSTTNHEKPLVAILPGSRRQEISKMLDTMLQVVPEFPQYQFVVAGVDNIPQSFYEHALQRSDVQVVFNQTYDLLAEARAAVVASGTASLETALFEVPQIVCYRTSWLTYWMAKQVIKVKYISLVNLIADRLVIPELIQAAFTADAITKILKDLLEQGSAYKDQMAGYRQVKMLMGNQRASREAALSIKKLLSGD